MSVYAPSGPAWPDESAPVRRKGVEPDDDPLQERSLAKLAAEAVLAEVFDGKVLLPRVGIMVGPRDPSHRFTYWPTRFAAALAGDRDRRVLGPGDPGRPVQYTDARDVGSHTIIPERSSTERSSQSNAISACPSLAAATLMFQALPCQPSQLSMARFKSTSRYAGMPPLA